MEYTGYIICALNITILIIALAICVIASKNSRSGRNAGEAEEKVKELQKELSLLRGDIKTEQEMLRGAVNRSVNESVATLGEAISAGMKSSGDYQRQQLEDMNLRVNENLSRSADSLNSQLARFEERLKTSSLETSQKLEVMNKTMESRLDGIRTEVEAKLRNIQEDNNKRLEGMRQVVDEKLEKTLSQRMTESFKLVNDRLEQVYKGLGEMQTLAQGVGDLKKVMTNVKTRGIMGEIQLGAILEEILSPNQYDRNVITKKGSGKFVEYAVKLPSEDGSFVYLPVDSKFPGETYGALCDAYESGTPEQIQERRKQLINTIKSEAKDIRDKYIDSPNTTEFAVMFLPFEGLYAEAVNQGLVEILQRDYHVNLAGPSTMAAFLNSLQMGFRTFAIQKRSSEVWQVLGAVKTEFDKFSEALESAQKRITQANDELERLVGTRTRQMKRKLKDVTLLTDNEAEEILEIYEGEKE